jgi:hypothetical protein
MSDTRPLAVWGLRHYSGSLDEAALPKHNVLALWSQAGIPAEFLHKLRTVEGAETGQ